MNEHHKIIVLKNKWGEEVKIFTDNIEDAALEQVKELMDSPMGKGAHIRIMPDVHAGKGCVIGTTMRIVDKVCPNLVGVDIGCGMLTAEFAQLAEGVDLEKFDAIVHANVPAGFNVHNVPLFPSMQLEVLENLHCWDRIRNKQHIFNSLGTLGGGNHFIELNKDEKGWLYLVIHTGSRNLGSQVAKIYQDMAVKHCKAKSSNKDEIIKQLKAEGRHAEIQDVLKSIVDEPIAEHLAYLEGDEAMQYIHDMHIVQKWAEYNRGEILWALTSALVEFGDMVDHYHTVHNYIDDRFILRKGAVSAKQDERITIPINMRDGSLLCLGTGDEDWNYSAPHGAGRAMSRSQARKGLDMAEFKESMAHIYSSTVVESTLDEAPSAYKPMSNVVDNIQDSAEIVYHLTPIYNFKAV